MLANLLHESAGFQVEAFGGFVRLNEWRNLCLADGGGAAHKIKIQEFSWRSRFLAA